HTRFSRDWSSDVCSSDLIDVIAPGQHAQVVATIEASRKAVAGDYVTNLEAKTPEKTATASLRVSVRTPLLWGWLGILIILGALEIGRASCRERVWSCVGV